MQGKADSCSINHTSKFFTDILIVKGILEAILILKMEKKTSKQNKTIQKKDQTHESLICVTVL